MRRCGVCLVQQYIDQGGDRLKEDILSVFEAPGHPAVASLFLDQVNFYS